jgi:hypothetical protein
MAKKYNQEEEVDDAESVNQREKELFNNLIKTTALDLRANYQTAKTNAKVKDQTIGVMKYLAQNLNGRDFAILNKYLHELRNEVLNNKHHALGPDSFNSFLTKVAELSPMGSHHG